MNKQAIKRQFHKKIYSLLVNIDQIKLIGSAIVEDENRTMTDAERKNTEKVYHDLLLYFGKKSKCG